jgi:hypothetical protein
LKHFQSLQPSVLSLFKQSEELLFARNAAMSMLVGVLATINLSVETTKTRQQQVSPFSRGSSQSLSLFYSALDHTMDHTNFQTVFLAVVVHPATFLLHSSAVVATERPPSDCFHASIASAVPTGPPHLT